MKEKKFTIVVAGDNVEGLTESMVRRALIDSGFTGTAKVQAWEHNKMCECDGCGKPRRDVKACGRDSNGDPDSPDLCFVCRKEAQRGRPYSRKMQRYVYPNEAEVTEDQIPF